MRAVYSVSQAGGYRTRLLQKFAQTLQSLAVNAILVAVIGLGFEQAFNVECANLHAIDDEHTHGSWHGPRRICGWAIQQASLFELARIINLVEDAMRRTLNAARHRYACSGEHLVQRAAAMPSFHRVQNKFAAVLRAYDSGHAAYLSPAGAVSSGGRPCCPG